MHLRPFPALALLLVLSSFPAAAQLHRVGAPVRLESGGALAPHPQGGFLLAFADLESDDVAIYARRFDAAGTAGPAHLVAVAPVVTQYPYELVPLPGNVWAVTWVTDAPSAPAARSAPVGGAAALPGDGTDEPGAVNARLVDGAGRPVGEAVRLNPGSYGWSPAAGAAPGGGFVVAWSTDDGLLARRFDSQAAPLGPEVVVRSRSIDMVLTGGEPAPLPGGGFAVPWSEFRPEAGGGIFVRRYDGDGAPLGEALELSPVDAFGPPVAAADAAGGFVVAWTRAQRPPQFELYEQWVAARRVGPGGAPAGAEFAIDRAIEDDSDAYVRGLTMEPDGRFVVAWDRYDRAPLALHTRALVRPFAADGTPEGPALHLGAARPGEDSSAALLRDPTGGWLASWYEADPDFKSYVQCLASGGCGGAASHLCLQQGRFRVEVDWRLRDGASGAGQAVPLGADSGAFWFFAPENLELMVKVLDGRALNGRFWVFLGALSDVEYTVTVTDTATGEQRSYHNPAGTMASRADTAAF